MTRPTSTICATLFTALFSMQGMADIRVATGNGYEPFTDEDLPHGGLATELVVEAFAAVGREVEVDFRPWARGYWDTKQGLFAGTFPYVHSDERAAEMLYSTTPLAEVLVIVVSSADNPVEFDGLHSFEGRTLCSALGYAELAEVQAMIDDGRLNEESPAEVESCPRMIEAGRADFFLPNNFTWLGLAASLNLDHDDFQVAEEPVATNALYFITAQTDEGAAMIDLFDAGLERLHDTGRYEEIATRHMSQ